MGAAHRPQDMRTRFVWKDLVRLGPFRWNALAVGRAGRVALGVIVPLAAGWSLGNIEYGAYVALGALPAGFASFQGETRGRLTAVAVASLGMAVSTFVGATAAATAPWLLVPVVALWAYLTGLSVALGQRSNVAILQWSVALLIAVGLPFGPSQAALRAALVLAGGLLQAALVAATWTIRPGARERAMLAASYRALSTYALDLAAGRSEPPPAVAFPADAPVDDPNPLIPWATRLAFVDLLEEAERLRASLAALTAYEQGSGDAGDIRPLLQKIAGALSSVSEALAAGRARRAALISDFGERLSAVTVVTDAPWRWAGEALLGQLRAVQRILADLAGISEPSTANSPSRMPPLIQPQRGMLAALLTLRANITTTSEAGRHALRLALVAVIAEAIVQTTRLYQGRWVILTIFLVLKPDYASTLYRGFQRAAGTMLGAALGSTASLFAGLGQGGLVATAGTWIAAAYALFDVNYLLFSVCLTAFIVCLLDLLGSSAVPIAEARLVDTVIGAGLALTAYLVWPTWEGVTAQEKFARLVEAHRTYATALLRALAHRGGTDVPQLRSLQIAARRARSDAEAAAVRLSSEPVLARFTPELAAASIAAVAQLAHAELALHALVLHEGQAGTTKLTGETVRKIDDLNTALTAALDRLALGFRHLQPPGPIPALRPIQAGLRDDRQMLGSAIARITDRLVDATDTLDAILRVGTGRHSDNRALTYSG